VFSLLASQVQDCLTFLKKDDLKQISIKDSIDDTWIKTLTKINKWTEDKLEIGLINKIKIN